MAKNFIITGFADEISSDIDVQFAHLNRLGIRWFEPRGIDGKNIADLTIDEAKELKRKMDVAGVRASSIGSPIGKISITDPFEPHLAKLCHVLELAKILETSFVRVFSFYIPQGDNRATWRNEVMARMKKMAEVAEAEGITLLHENEGGIYGDEAKDCRDILDTVNAAALGCVFDPGNFAYYGHEAYPEAFALLKDKITYFHIKDAKRGGEIVPAGEGDGCIKEVLSQVAERETPYFLSLEPHLGNFAGLDKLQKSGKLSKLPDGGPDTFGLALDSLKSILKEIDARWE
ncbi:MAG: sugar phosphate isomerase/epimerase [Clostridia bacterium]|nr:sugar phosphate isomerase/epimerase [Clostridia bacterium]